MSLPTGEIDPATNERACHLVLRNIAKRPQTLDSAWITADDALDWFDTRDETDVSIRVLGRIDPFSCSTLADKANALHEGFGVRPRISEWMAAATVKRLAGAALLFVQNEIEVVGQLDGVSVPDEIYEVAPQKEMPLAGDRFHDYLGGQPDILSRVKESVKRRANYGRKNVGKHQRRALLIHGYGVSQRS